MRRRLGICALLFFRVTLHAISDSDLGSIQFDQKISQLVSRDLVFRDETGKNVSLDSFLDKRPVLLLMGYYKCPMLCNMALNGMVECLQDLRGAGQDRFQLIFVSIDPKETPALAAAKKEIYLKRYGRKNAAEQWHFLTGAQASITALSEQIGFHSVYDPATGQYAHPSGFVVLTPRGRIYRYFFGIQFSAAELDQSLRSASSEKTGSRVKEFILLCFHYAPLKGKYAAIVLAVVRGAGVATLGGLAFILWRGTKRARLTRAGGGGK